MKNLAIQAENISKQYRLGEVGTGTLSHDLNRFWAKMRGKEDPYLKIGESNDRGKKAESDYVWSLRDINFKIEQGDAVGVIGRNGAGKSTLLKLLSKVTRPTTGSFKVNGRIASLLEVGTGFNPEMTGKENIYLNGAILGMRKHEITRKFDEIVDFSGVERYIDTPVKRYSSGMYVRLAFAVAAYLESEILIVDEVLAVGDAEFQKKCLGKMGDVSKGEGRTVLFVSHNMAAIQSLCKSSIFLENGKLKYDIAPTNFIVDKYLQANNEYLKNLEISSRKDRDGVGNLKIISAKILNETKKEVLNLISGASYKFEIIIENIQRNFDQLPIEVAISISKISSGVITVLSSKYINFRILNNKEQYKINFNIDKLPLTSGLYSANIIVRKQEIIEDWVKESITFEVTNGDYYKTGTNIPDSHGGVYVEYKMEI